MLEPDCMDLLIEAQRCVDMAQTLTDVEAGQRHG
jgi:hypothetical protein